MQIFKLDLNLSKSTVFKSICHTWFIVKDKGMEINWHKPLVQKSQITTEIKLSKEAFAEGAMRYAFFMKDLVCG